MHADGAATPPAGESGQYRRAGVPGPGARRAASIRAAALLALPLLGAACAPERPDARSASAPPGDTLLVLAAANVQQALGEIAGRFETASGVHVQLVFGSSGNLATQIEHGIPADVFLSADEAFVDRLIAGGHLGRETRLVYGVGRLAMVAAPGRRPPAAIEALAGREYGTIAIANPEVAPYGRAAREALRRAGVWPAVERRVVYAEDIAQALQFARSGNADVALVALALVAGAPDADAPRVVVADSLHAPLRQAAGVLTQSKRPAAAAAFLRYLGGPEARRILERFGFGAGA